MVISLLRVLARQLLGFLDVARLSGLVATDEQQDVVATVLNEVHPVAWPMVNLQFGDTFANWFDGAEVPERQAPDSYVYADARRSIFQRREPLLVLGCLANFNHTRSVSHGIR